MFAAIAQRAALDPAVVGRSAADLGAEGATLLDVVVDAAIGVTRGGAIHERIGRYWDLGRRGCEHVRRALVLLADHELNASTFAARVAVSTGASLAAASLAGLAALSGPRHGGLAAQVRRLAREAPPEPREAVAARLAFRPPPPGFGHPLYPEGDPRALALLDGVAQTPALEALARAVQAETGAKYNMDFALAAVSEELDLPEDAPFILFAVARSAGWIAHAIEQTASGALIRPRARYLGPLPDI
jgi:citrate synthase